MATLDRQGLLVRRPDPAHGRRLCTSLTTAGHARLALEDRMLAGLTGEQRAVLRTHLDTCCTALRQM